MIDPADIEKALDGLATVSPIEEDDLVQAEHLHRRQSTQKMPPVEGVARGRKYS